ncbi:MAG: hypothetical protein ACI4JZ_01645, partial [Oscillospiraceae bacterium]
ASREICSISRLTRGFVQFNGKFARYRLQYSIKSGFAGNLLDITVNARICAISRDIRSISLAILDKEQLRGQFARYNGQFAWYF